VLEHARDDGVAHARLVRLRQRRQQVHVRALRARTG